MSVRVYEYIIVEYNDDGDVVEIVTDPTLSRARSEKEAETRALISFGRTDHADNFGTNYKALVRPFVSD